MGLSLVKKGAKIYPIFQNHHIVCAMLQCIYYCLWCNCTLGLVYHLGLYGNETIVQASIPIHLSSIINTQNLLGILQWYLKVPDKISLLAQGVLLQGEIPISLWRKVHWTLEKGLLLCYLRDANTVSSRNWRIRS